MIRSDSVLASAARRPIHAVPCRTPRGRAFARCGRAYVHVPDLSVRPLRQNSTNSAHVWNSWWLSFASIMSSIQSSSHVAAPKDGQYSLSLSLMIQMPSPDEPRFCLITRGWYAIVFLKPVMNASLS